MSYAARRWLLYTLFAIWCLSVSLTMYNLLLPWSQVLVTAGVIYFIAGGMLGLFGGATISKKAVKDGESTG